MPGPDLAALIGTVQKNCDIADARHAGELTMCIFLLRMRDFYCWEHELAPGREVSREAVGAWMEERERIWQALEDTAFEQLPLEAGTVDPFQTEHVNAALADHGLVYSAGYGRRGRPQFFLGELVRTERRDGYEVRIAGCEYARDMEAHPGMLLGDAVFVRTETLRRWLWDRVEEWRWTRKNEALARALACYPFDADPQGALEAMTRVETESVILHELGEARIGAELGEAWPALLADLAGTREEIVARALRDLCADCLSTLPALAERGEPAPIHFHFANFTGMRRELEPGLADAYGRWAQEGDAKVLGRAAQATLGRARERALALLAVHGGGRSESPA
jgi:hypothetical protein